MIKIFSVVCETCGMLQRAIQRPDREVTIVNPLPDCPTCGGALQVSIEERPKPNQRNETALQIQTQQPGGVV